MFSRCLLVGRREEIGTCDLSETVRSESQGQVATSGRISLGFCNYKVLIEHNKEHQESSHQEAIKHHLGLAFILPGCLQSHPLSSTRTLIGKPEPKNYLMAEARVGFCLPSPSLLKSRQSLCSIPRLTLSRSRSEEPKPTTRWRSPIGDAAHRLE